MKLSKWAQKQGVCYRTAWNLFKAGQIPNSYKLKSGTIIVDEEKSSYKTEHNVVYARVSSSENRDNLETQAHRVSLFCSARGWVVHEIIKECASGLNDKRPKLEKLLLQRKATRIIVEHKDRLTRCGFNYIKTLLTDCEIIVINESIGEKEDLMNDFVSLVTSFCARLYGNRRSKRQTEKLIKELKND
jgi:predicted site-specific integrase-resolvase